MRVLVTGASGFLGRHVVARLLKGGHSVRAMVRPAAHAPDWQGAVELVRADLRSGGELLPAFRDIDAVIHLAAGTSGSEDDQFVSSVIATENFLDVMAKSSVKRLLHVSSLVVYDWTLAKGVMTEDTPLVKDVYDLGGYTIAKSWQERLVERRAKANGWDLTILRPGFIWGPEHAAIAGMGRRFGRAYVMFGPFTRLPLTHVVNCADGLVAALEAPDAVGQIFNVVDGDDIRVWRYVREYDRHSGRRGFMVPVPYIVGLGIAYLALFLSRTLFGKKGQLPSLLVPRRFTWQFKPIRFSAVKLKSKLHWTPPLSFEQCVKQTYGER
jgi:UDP-glucose 4-epimerase